MLCLLKIPCSRHILMGILTCSGTAAKVMQLLLVIEVSIKLKRNRVSLLLLVMYIVLSINPNFLIKEIVQSPCTIMGFRKIGWIESNIFSKKRRYTISTRKQRICFCNNVVYVSVIIDIILVKLILN